MEPRFEKLSIGGRLRAARQRQGLTLENVAQSTGLTKSFLSRIERNETSPSVSTLLVICDTLSVPVGALFDTPKLGVVRSAEAPGILLVGMGADERLLTPRSQPSVQVIRSTIAPGGCGGDPYTLNCETEVLHVLAGSLTVSFSDRQFDLAAGDTVTFSGREPHTWLNNDTTQTAEVMWVLVPASWSSPGADESSSAG